MEVLKDVPVIITLTVQALRGGGGGGILILSCFAKHNHVPVVTCSPDAAALALVLGFWNATAPWFGASTGCGGLWVAPYVT